MVVVVNLWVVHLATQDPPIKESEKPYEAGEAYEGELQTWRASAALGYAAAVSAERGLVRIELKDRAGAAVVGLKGTIGVARNERTDRDQTLEVKEIAPGTYEAKGDLALAGLWRIKSSLGDARGTWLDDRRVWVQP